MTRCVHVWLVDDGPANINFACELCGCLVGVFFTALGDRVLLTGKHEAKFNVSAQLLHDTGVLVSLDDMMKVANIARHMFLTFVRDQQPRSAKRGNRRRVAVAA